ncbi:hypothetical protein HU200_033194 [Digitaria exilis]|uniref:Uncharacterized protein n=1 Tax=Digitaria exilis TaxID=1010633 RepID=A0A835EPQ6_9POAL|nr:hypothetical protein HU200_033194 [Digitaria exilis]
MIVTAPIAEADPNDLSHRSIVDDLLLVGANGPRRPAGLYDSYAHPVYGVIGFVGELFMWGAAGGAAFHFARGLRGAPSGSGARLALAGAVRAASANAPRVGGTFAAYCAALSAIETAVSHARDSVDMWCSVSASAALWGLHGMRRGGAVAAARGALLGTTGGLAIYGTHHASMVRASRQADADSLLRQKRMMAPIAASRTAAAPPIDGPTSAAILYGKYDSPAPLGPARSSLHPLSLSHTDTWAPRVRAFFHLSHSHVVPDRGFRSSPPRIHAPSTATIHSLSFLH